jgi:hypothetical protein
LEEDIIELDDRGLADALDDLCVSKPRTDASDVIWNKIDASWVLPTTVHCPPSQSNLALGIRFGSAEISGDRSYMEDRIFTNPCLEGSESSNQIAFFGVFDGHNGEYVAEALQDRMRK